MAGSDAWPTSRRRHAAGGRRRHHRLAFARRRNTEVGISPRDHHPGPGSADRLGLEHQHAVVAAWSEARVQPVPPALALDAPGVDLRRRRCELGAVGIEQADTHAYGRVTRPPRPRADRNLRREHRVGWHGDPVGDARRQALLESPGGSHPDLRRSRPSDLAALRLDHPHLGRVQAGQRDRHRMAVSSATAVQPAPGRTRGFNHAPHRRRETPVAASPGRRQLLGLLQKRRLERLDVIVALRGGRFEHRHPAIAFSHRARAAAPLDALARHSVHHAALRKHAQLVAIWHRGESELARCDPEEALDGGANPIAHVAVQQTQREAARRGASECVQEREHPVEPLLLAVDVDDNDVGLARHLRQRFDAGSRVVDEVSAAVCGQVVQVERRRDADHVHDRLMVVRVPQQVRRRRSVRADLEIQRGRSGVRIGSTMGQKRCICRRARAPRRGRRC